MAWGGTIGRSGGREVERDERNRVGRVRLPRRGVLRPAVHLRHAYVPARAPGPRLPRHRAAGAVGGGRTAPAATPRRLVHRSLTSQERPVMAESRDGAGAPPWLP